ncbi:hemagglutinin repeat-containing protein, partial [Desulfobulbus elongatus]|uniref:two-partner secretion domain-containing protein n=1 Tax=Desulfobulbus elongatus TaxID=53332 RepID=UPI00048266C5
MNRHCYRIIFNRQRGLLMVVAEIVPGRGKAGGNARKTRARSVSSRHGAWAALMPVVRAAVGTMLALGCCSVAQARIVADPAAPGNQRPTVLAAPNNVPLVNIQTPSKAGVSRNTYSRFDVEEQGAILNNSRTSTQTQLGGWVEGNPWLAAGSAKIILNEINSSDPSRLDGFVEVAGQRAEVVIANPAGIKVDGGGFINASRATLTTGSPVVDNGNLAGYQVRGGRITVEGRGFDTSTADYTDLIARAVEVNAGLWARELKVTAGANQVDAEHIMATPIAGNGPAPALAIDTAQLGGMYAGKITLVGTEAGVGVRNSGEIGAGAGEIVVTADGRLENSGRITGTAGVRVDSAAGIANSGTVFTQGDAVLSTRGDIVNSGVVAAQKNTSLAATGAASAITSTTDSVLAAGVQDDGNLGASGDLTVRATRQVTAQGRNLAGGELTVSGRSLDLAGSRTSSENIGLSAAAGDLDLSDASVAAGNRLIASAGQTLRTDRAVVSATWMSLGADDLSNVMGELVQVGAGSFDLALTGALDNSGGTISANQDLRVRVGEDFRNIQGSLAANGRIDLGAGTIDNRSGTIGSGQGGVDLAALAGSLDNSGGTISANQGLRVRVGEDFRNIQGLLAANGQVDLGAGTIDNRSGTIGSGQSGVDLAALTGSLDNSGGRIEAAGAFSLASLGLTNVDGVLFGSSLHLDSQGRAFDNTRGLAIATGGSDTGAFILDSGTLINEAGLLQAKGQLTIDTHGRNLRNTHSGATGGIVGQADINLFTGDVDNAAGFIGAGGGIDIVAAHIANTGSGTIVGSGALTLSGTGLDNRGGQIQVMGEVDLTLGGELNNTAGLVRSGQTLSVAARSLVNADTQGTDRGLEGKDVRVTASTLNNRYGAIRADRDATLTIGTALDNTVGLVSAGLIASLRDLAAVRTLAIVNSGGTLIGGQLLRIDSATLGGDGNLFSRGDLEIALTDNYLHTGQLQANGSARLVTAGTLTNRSAMSAGQTLTVRAAGIDNQADGSLAAMRTDLETAGSLTNRGLIDGTETWLIASTLNNLGTGRMYGDFLAIGATTLYNGPENGTAPVIAARERLDIGAAVIENREHALLFSVGDMAIGGGLDADRRATGRAAVLTNASATIEALGNLAIGAERLDNTNEHFGTEDVQVSSQYVEEFQPLGSGSHYRSPEAVHRICHPYHCVDTPEGTAYNFYRYKITETITETRVTESDPAQILAGGAMVFDAGDVLNDKSRIIAGGAIGGTIGSLTNNEATGERVISASGVVGYYSLDSDHGNTDIPENGENGGWRSYDPAPVVQTITLDAMAYRQNTAPGGTGTGIGGLVTDTVAQTPGGSGPVNHAVAGGRIVTPVVQVAALTGNGVVATGGIDTRVPNNSLFVVRSNPGSSYLVETDPRFADYRQWLSSDYLLDALATDPALTQKRLGDGFYEQKLIRDQIAQLTGRRFLDGYAGDEEQYRALMDNGATFAEAYGLRPGVALTAEQMAQLTSDIVWLVAETVVLPDGTTTEVLVPQVYVRVQAGDLQASGALIAGDSIDLRLEGDLTNSGTIAGRDIVALTADNVRNLGGRIMGNDVGIQARMDLDNLGGTVAAENSLTVLAGRDLTLMTTTRTQESSQGSRTNIDRVAGLYVTGGSGNLTAAAGRDLTLSGAVVSHAGTGATTLHAGRDLQLATVREAANATVVWDADNFHREASHTDLGTVVQTRGDLYMHAGNDLTLKAATVTSDQGAVVAMAGRDVTLSAGEGYVYADDAHKVTKSSMFSSTTTITRDTLEQTSALGTTLSGETATVMAGRDLTVFGSNVVSTSGTGLFAGEDIVIQAATDTSTEEHFRSVKKSGLLSSGGIGFTIGSQEQSLDQQGTRTSAVASTIGSMAGGVTIAAGGEYRQIGSHVLAPQGDIDIAARRIEIVEARETSTSRTETKFRQSGLSVGLSTPVLTALQTGEQMAESAKDTKDVRMQALAGAATGLAAMNAYDAVVTSPDQAGGINVNISLGTSKSQSIANQWSDTAAGSMVAAGGNVRIRATGGGVDSDLTIRGSEVSGGNAVILQADDAISFLAAKNSAALHSTNSSSNGSIGVAVGSGGVGVAASGSWGKGNADGDDVIYTNTHVTAGNTVSMESGGDTRLAGAVVSGNRVVAEVGGDLSIESLQGTSVYNASQKNVGGSLTVGAGMVGGNVSYNRSTINSDYASVAEQSGIRTGDQGFSVRVRGNTDLTGGVIASTDAAVVAGRNSFATSGLTMRDIENRAEYDAKGVGVNVGKGWSPSGELVPQGTGAGIGEDSGSAASVTRSGISGIAGNTDVRANDAETGIKPIFDAEKVQKEIDAQVAITQKF